MDFYILKNKRPIKTKDMKFWCDWMFGKNNAKNRNVAVTKIGRVTVSTVFLGIDHNMSFIKKGQNNKALFETMIFGSNRKVLQDYQVRYATYLEALLGHKLAVKILKK